MRADFYIRNKKERILYDNFNTSNDRDAWSNTWILFLYNVLLKEILLYIENSDQYPRLTIFRRNYMI